MFWLPNTSYERRNVRLFTISVIDEFFHESSFVRRQPAETGSIKIAYVPVQEEPAGEAKNLLKLISQLKADVIDEYKEYLDQFALLVFRNTYHIRELTSRIGLMRRELYLRTSVSS